MDGRDPCPTVYEIRWSRLSIATASWAMWPEPEICRWQVVYGDSRQLNQQIAVRTSEDGCKSIYIFYSPSVLRCLFHLLQLYLKPVAHISFLVLEVCGNGFYCSLPPFPWVILFPIPTHSRDSTWFPLPFSQIPPFAISIPMCTILPFWSNKSREM